MVYRETLFGAVCMLEGSSAESLPLLTCLHLSISPVSFSTAQIWSLLDLTEREMPGVRRRIGGNTTLSKDTYYKMPFQRLRSFPDIWISRKCSFKKRQMKSSPKNCVSNCAFWLYPFFNFLLSSANVFSRNTRVKCTRQVTLVFHLWRSCVFDKHRTGEHLPHHYN